MFTSAWSVSNQSMVILSKSGVDCNIWLQAAGMDDCDAPKAASEASLIMPQPRTFCGFSSTILLIEKIQLVRDGLIEILGDYCPEYQIRIETRAADVNRINPALIILSGLDEVWSQHPTSATQSTNAASTHMSPILLIGESDDPGQALMALRAGFAGFFPATQSAKMLIAAVRLVLAGGRFWPPSLVQLSLENSTWEGFLIQRERTNGKPSRES